MKLLQSWIKRYGIPKAIYVDLKTVYVSPKTFKLEDEQHGLTEAFTHFSRACAKLGIKIIKAYSAQAKGRVERKHAVFQDRFVKELQLKNIKTIIEANRLLKNNFLYQINKKFSKLPMNSESAHRDAKIFGNFKHIFCWEYTRKVQNDWTVRFDNKRFQIQKTIPLIIRAKQYALIRVDLNGIVSLWHGESLLSHKEIDCVSNPAYVKKGYDSAALSHHARKNKQTSPWRQFNSGWLNPKLKEIKQPESV